MILTIRLASKRYLNSKSGAIISPYWPSKQSGSFFGSECEWEIKVPSNYVIKMNFMDLDLDTSGFYCKSSSNRLRLKGNNLISIFSFFILHGVSVFLNVFEYHNVIACVLKAFCECCVDTSHDIKLRKMETPTTSFFPCKWQWY